MKFLIITKTPSRQGLIGPVPEKITYDEVEGASVEEVRDRLHVPFGGECIIVPAGYAITIKARIINEIV